MSLIESHRHSRADLIRWAEYADQDEAHWTCVTWRRVRRAVETIREFVADGPCYAGVSWGKDSVVLAHLIAAMGAPVPLAWVRLSPIANPDCEAVRDAFLARFPDIDYRELVAGCPLGEDGWWDIDAGWDPAMATMGDRYLSGVRGDESSIRGLRMRRWGTTTRNTCAPIGWWTSDDVFAYLNHHDLPIHPAYAMSMDGTMDRGRLRVATLTGPQGDGHGRAHWERRYYGRELAAIEEERQCRLRR